MKKIKYIIVVIALLLSGCKEKSEILSGDITGKINVTEQDQSPAPDNSGVETILYDYNGNLISSFLTESSGIYIFRDIPYGRYRIELQKQGYLQGNEIPSEISHIGGYSPTLKDLNIFEVPGYEITIDSVKTDSLNYCIYFCTLRSTEKQNFHFSIMFWLLIMEMIRMFPMKIIPVWQPV